MGGGGGEAEGRNGGVVGSVSRGDNDKLHHNECTLTSLT